MRKEIVNQKDRVVDIFRNNPNMMGTDIAEELGVTRQYVAKVLHEAGEDAMQRQKDVTEARYKQWEREFVEKYSPDTTMREMAETLGISMSMVTRISNRLGLKFRTLANVRKLERYTEIMKLREKGMTMKEVGEEIGVTIGYVQRMVRWGREQLEKEEVAIKKALKDIKKAKKTLQEENQEGTEDNTHVDEVVEISKTNE